MRTPNLGTCHHIHRHFHSDTTFQSAPMHRPRPLTRRSFSQRFAIHTHARRHTLVRPHTRQHIYHKTRVAVTPKRLRQLCYADYGRDVATKTTTTTERLHSDLRHGRAHQPVCIEIPERTKLARHQRRCRQRSSSVVVVVAGGPTPMPRPAQVLFYQWTRTAE